MPRTARGSERPKRTSGKAGFVPRCPGTFSRSRWVCGGISKKTEPINEGCCDRAREEQELSGRQPGQTEEWKLPRRGKRAQENGLLWSFLIYILMRLPGSPALKSCFRLQNKQKENEKN